MVATPSSVIAAAVAAIAAPAMLTTAATTATASVVIVGCASLPDPEAADHDGKRDRRGDPAYLGAQLTFWLGRYLHSNTTSRNRLPLHLLAAVCFAAAARSRLRNRESAVFF